MDVSLSELRELVMDREAWRGAIHRVAKSRTGMSDWTELNWVFYYFFFLDLCILRTAKTSAQLPYFLAGTFY